MKKVNCILLIDDNEADNEFHKRAIVKAGAADHVEIATSGQKGLDYLLSCDAPERPRPDIIFLDINMPGMNGFEFLEEYNQLEEKYKSKMVVFMLTSSLMTEDKNKAEGSGQVSAFLNKPLTAEGVRKIVDEHFN